MDKIEEFLYHLKNNYPKVLQNTLDEFLLKTLKKVDNLNEIDDDIYNNIVDQVENYITDNCVHIPSGDIKHFGGDESVFEDGIYYTKLFEIHNFYFYQTAEGEIFGLFTSLEEAEKESYNY